MDVFPGATLRRVFLGGGVHPEWRRRGIGREVLRWQTARAHEALTEQETGTPEQPRSRGGSLAATRST